MMHVSATAHADRVARASPAQIELAWFLFDCARGIHRQERDAGKPPPPVYLVQSIEILSSAAKRTELRKLLEK